MPFLRKLRRPWYAFLQFLCRLLVTVLFGYRAWGQRHVPSAGGALLLSSHQSFLDPVLVGVPMLRPLNYLARKTLFRFAPLRASRSSWAEPPATSLIAFCAAVSRISYIHLVWLLILPEFSG